MSQVNFTTLNTPDKNLQLIQSNIQNALAQIQNTEFLGGVYLTGVVISSGTPLTISHGLGRIPVIWVVGDKNANSNIWRSAWTNTTITLNASVNCTISVWVN